MGLFGPSNGNSTGFVGVVPLDLSFLPAFYAAQRAQTGTAAAANQPTTQIPEGSSRGPATILPPWDVNAERLSQSARLKDALTTNQFIDLKDPAFAGDDVHQDHRNLFALYKGLSTLGVLANHAVDEKTVSGLLPSLDQRFQTGLTEILAFVSNTAYEELTVLPGEKSDNIESNLAIPKSTLSQFTGRVVHKGAYDDLLTNINGDEVFTISVLKSGVTTDVTIDLSQIAPASLTIDGVIDHINTQLEANGAVTRFKRKTLETGQYGLFIQGVSTETLTLSAAATEPALYLAGASGTGDKATGLVQKFDSLNAAAPTQLFSERIDPENASANPAATAIDSEGNLYVVGNSNGDFGTHINQAEQDTFLTKYDSSGNLVWTRLLGASDRSEGFAVAVDSSDNVVVTGQVKGDLTKTTVGGGYDTFVTKYNSAGEEQFTRQTSPLVDDGGQSVMVAADGSIFIAGYTKGPLTNSVTHAGGSDAFITKLNADGSLAFHRQFGSAGTDEAIDIDIASDGNIVVASVENGDAVVTKYSGADGTSAALWQVNLGSLNGGQLGSLTIDGSAVYVGGTTSNANLNAAGQASIATAHSGGSDGFVTRIDDAGNSATANFTSYVGTSATDSVTSVEAYGGNVYISGQTAGVLPGQTLSGSQNGYVAKLDGTGVLQWAHQYSGYAGKASAQSLVVDGTGSSVLDALGLPNGKVVYNQSTRVTDNSTVRPGDYFSISVNGKAAKTIRIETGDKLSTIALKINLAIGLNGKASVKSGADGSQLKIEAREGYEIELFPGKDEFNALRGLGLAQGKIINDGSSLLNGSNNDDKDKAATKGPLIFGLSLTDVYSLADRDKAVIARDAITNALSEIRDAYRELTRDPALDDLLSKLNGGGQAPAYLQAQLANYQAGLVRLQAGGGGAGVFF